MHMTNARLPAWPSTRASGWLLLAVLLSLPFASPRAERIKDIASIDGVRDNQLVGYGLVVGLDGSGDRTTQAPFTGQSLENMLAQLGVTVPPDVRIQVNNVAAVMVTADLPAFARPGQRIDITVSSIANASSLRGGTLVMTPLKGVDGGVYAMAQGNLIVGGLDASGDDGSRITVNVPSVGRIPGGATVEREVQSGFGQSGPVTLNLHQADFTTATRMTEAINEAMGSDTAQPLDAGAVKVQVPDESSARIPFIAALETLEVEPGEAPARVIVSARTGTVIIGRQVRITPAAVSHGSLVVRITERPEVSQPNALSEGETREVPRSQIEVSQGNQRMFRFDPGVTLDSLVESVNRVGAAPGDLVAILQALKRAGALRAELVVI